MGITGCRHGGKVVYASEALAVGARATPNLVADAGTAWRIAIWTVSA
jgi:hypothetical protein